MPFHETEDGNRLFYQLRGTGRGRRHPPIVFIHGWCSNLRHWDAQLRHFAKGHRVLALDRRGHGRSDIPRRGYTPRQHARDIEGSIRALRLRGVIAVGHAGGGSATLELAERNPELVRAAVLVDSILTPPADLEDPQDPGGIAYRAILEGLEGAAGKRALREMYSGYFSAQAGAAGRKAVREALETPLAVAAAEIRGLTAGNQASARKVQQPVLWLSSGGFDEARIRSLLRDVRFARVVGAGHFPQIEVPEQVNAMIDRFLALL